MSIKTLNDLPGFKEENISELEQIGIRSVSELKEAVFDEAGAKKIIKTLSGVGPKTVEHWKELFKDEAKAEPKADAKKKDVEIVDEPEAESEVVESGAYVVKAKPELSDETAEGLAKRAIISGRRPAFKRQEWHRYAMLGEKWRKPKGIHSKMKRRLKRRGPIVDIGFRGPASVRGLHPSGFEEVLVHNVDNLEDIDPKVQAVRIGGTVGTKKRMAIEDRAAELGIRVLNRMV
ncbi:50S ribosomal protein L32e [Candidatus Methanoplasma termitum]|uniref:Large ribosomal subunit protein eL32 n=1 Tax=Candidatus Methanoplasma termitum TaxID=1577791 RepID=A0A0A7LC99_9ARCH|nr:50S ribosomal protein L32e [Candidatus Methanoplasma termitum]AIZ56820.1 50S ribosomal protein L32e [Candidatus Methanoplasma termitum]MCL2334297.1 50S ribosomal protein L32e [Candidatus Methanoplasma sp.]